jgi:polyhydroxyalkanoate synthesis regulator phasin
LRQITEIWKKAGLFGIGMWALTEEKLQDITDELIENGEMQKEEGKKFVRDLMDEQKKQKQEMENKISAKVQETVDRADLASKSEVDELKEMIRSLESKIDNLKSEEEEEKDL